MIPPRQAPAASFPTDDVPPEVAELLTFTPVPRKVNRPDGWTADRQKRFIVLLAETGSPQRAALAIGKQLSGVEGVYRDDQTGEFRDAWDRALVIGAARQRRLDSGQGANGGPLPPHRRGDPPADEYDDCEMDEEEQRELLQGIFGKFVRKVEREREARLAGRIVEADFTLRQITMIEIMLELTSKGIGRSAWDVIGEARMGGHHVVQIAETPMSRWLDEARRAVWAEMGEPERPEHPPRRYLIEHDGHSTEMTEALRGGSDEFRAEQIAAREKQYREDAAAQVEWERRAHEAWEASEHDAQAAGKDN